MEIIFKNGYFVGLSSSFDQSKWLGDNGFWFYGRKSNARVADKMKAAGIALNSRYLPADRSEAIAHLATAPDLSWSAEAMDAIKGKADNLAASWAADSDFKVDAPDGLAYRPYQRAGISFACGVLAKFSGVILADEMGLGKTMQAIGYMKVRDPKRVLIVAPASLLVNWRIEIEKWLPEWKNLVHIVDPKQETPANARVVILNYEKVVGQSANAKAIRAALTGRGVPKWDLLVLDEAHMLKNPKAKRTKFFLGEFDRDNLKVPGLIHHAEKSILITGTPIQNKVRESESLLRAVGAFAPEGIFKDGGDFLFRHCGATKGQWGWTFDGATNLDELNAKLRAGGLMIRRLKVDVAKELPPKLRGIITLAYTGTHRMDRPAILDNPNADFDEAIKSLTTETMSFEEISAMRAALAVTKAPQVIEHVKTVLDANGKVLVFAHHKTLVDALVAEFGHEAIRIDGNVKPSERQALVDAFQNQDSIRVAILSTHAAGVGLTLTAASTVVFAEADWNPSWCVQAEDRAHRIGQTADNVTIQYLVLDGTLDAHVICTMVGKMEIANQVLDVRKVAAPAPAAPPPSVAAPSGPRQVEIKVGTFVITTDVKDAAAEGLRYLSSQCDGAVSDDNIGFNGRDAQSDFVQNLVAAARSDRGLSDKQAAWAVKILTTYKNTQVSHLADRLHIA